MITVINRNRNYIYKYSALTMINRTSMRLPSHHAPPTSISNYHYQFTTSLQHYLSRCLLSSTDAHHLPSGASVHAHLIKSPHHSTQYSLWNKLLNLYSRCAPLRSARNLFDEMPHRDVVSYNTLLSALTRAKEPNSTWVCVGFYSRMLKYGVLPNHVTVSVLLGSVDGSCLVGMLHAHAVKFLLFRNDFVGGSLVVGYARDRRIELAVRAFEDIEEPDMVSWNVMIDACARCGSAGHAVEFFNRMRLGNVACGFDYFTLTSVVKTCLGPRDLGLGMQLHSCAVKAGLELDTPVGNAIITMYSKCEQGLGSSVSVFWVIQHQNIISWTAMISGFSQNGMDKEAIEFYVDMLKSGLLENEFCFASVLPAVGGNANTELGRQVHARILKSVFGLDIGVGNALIDMYFKCGNVEDAQSTFDTMGQHDAVSWTTMISGFGQHGKGREAIDIFREMGQKGFQLDEVAFLVVLSACGHGGLVDEGLHIFRSMSTDFGIKPSEKHFACVVDMLGRAGKLEVAARFIEEMGMELDPLAWEALLGTCAIHGDIEIGRRSAEKVMELVPHKDGPYVLLSNLYAERQMWEEKRETRRKFDSGRLKKEVGRSWSAGL